MPLTSLPPSQRPRERLRDRGIAALTDAELLAILLRSGRVGESAVELAARLLAEFGGASGLARARAEELSRVPGIGEAKAASIVAAFGLARSTGRTEARPVLHEPTDIVSVARPHLDHLRRERVVILVCDSRHRVINVEVVSEGGADRALIPVREILNAVLRRDGSAFAVAHNHPAGDATPSEADVLATAALEHAAEAVGLRLLDHVVIAGGHWQVVERRRVR